MSFPPLPAALPGLVIDNHTHYDMVLSHPKEELLSALNFAETVGIAGIVQVGCDVETSQWAVWAAEQDARVVAAVALHPNEVPLLASEGKLHTALNTIDMLAQHRRVRAIGETGLDYFRTGPEGVAAQKESFAAHINLAKKHQLTLQIHDREAHEDVVKMLLHLGAPERVVFHCFSGDEKLARICAEHGWYLSFSGTLTFKNASGVQRALQIAPEELILVETDAPFLTPHPYRGQKNSSYMTAVTVRYMAKELGKDLEEFCHLIYGNTMQAYGSWDG